MKNTTSGIQKDTQNKNWLRITKQRIIFGLVVIMCALGFLSAQAQNSASIRGIIISASGETLPGVNVVLTDANKGTVTNRDGRFELTNVPPGKYILQASSVGYQTLKEDVEIKASRPVELTLKLEEEVVETETVNVFGKSVTRQINDQSYTVTAISAKKLYNSTSDANEILDRVPGVRILEDGGLGSKSNFTLNGFSGNQVKFFIDGIPMDNLGASFSLSDFPVNMIDRLEVYKGVVPVWLGTDALGGAVNIITNKKRQFVDASYCFGSFNTHRASVNAATTNPETGFTIRADANYNYSDNNYKVTVPITEGSTIIDTAEVERFHDRYRSGSLKLETGVVHKLYADNLLVGFMATINDKQVQNGATMAEPYGGIMRKNQSISPSLKYNKSDLFTEGLDLSLASSYTGTETQSIDTLRGVRYNWLGETYATGSDGENSRTNTTLNEDEVSTQFNLGYKLSTNSSLALNYSYAYFHRKAFDVEHPDNVSNQYPKSLNKHVIGLAYKIDANENWTTTLFGKYFWMNAKTSKTYSSAEDAMGEIASYENTKEDFGYGLASSYFIIKDLQVKASYEHALRLPAPAEIFGDGLFVEANPELEPEKSNNLNVGASYNFNTRQYNHFVIESSFIYRDSKDLIRTVVNPGSPVTSFNNLNRTKNIGVEGNFQYEWKDKFRLGANITYQNLTDEADSIYNDSYTDTGWQKNYHKNFRIPNKPYLFGNAFAGLTFKNLIQKSTVFSVDYYFNFVQKYYLTWVKFGYAGYNKDYIIPKQLSHDLQFSYSMRNGKYNISLDCKNIFNAQLYDKYYLQKPGRAFYLKLRYVL